jgi:hypothetical protein
MKTIPQQKFLANPLDESGHSQTPTSLTELSEYQPKTHWRPGDPLPKLKQPDPHAALARNADAFALQEAARQTKVLPFYRKACAPRPTSPTNTHNRRAA